MSTVEEIEEMRKCGILMPISSLPSEYGIGCFSKEAYEFVDELKNAGQSFWQILPLGPTSYGDSPYQSFSTFAGNPYFIDPETLVKKKWLTKAECDSYNFGRNKQSVDYAAIYASRFKLLKKAFSRSKIASDKGFAGFLKKNDFWLPDYALYMAVKGSFDNKSWIDWNEDIKLREPRAMEKYRKKFATEILFYEFQQYEFVLEWKDLKKYANDNGIKIIGDIPIYVAFDSSDAWAEHELFQFNDDCTPKAVAGCPPDAFSAEGQLWGNPLYDWEYHKKTGFAWWMKRLSHCFEMYDVVRIDHFRGFDAYYAIPYPAVNAVHGKWEKGPGYELFRTMKRELGDRDVIAEDLGFLTPSVFRLVKRTGYPGMKVLQFAFDSREESNYLPHNYNNNCIVYTGTHDNDTTLGWFRTFARADRDFAVRYLNIPKDIKDSEIPWAFIRAAYSSVSMLAIIPMQDVLSLDGKARMNRPATLGGNWQWRMRSGAFTKRLQKRLYDMAKLYSRVPKTKK